MNARLSLILCVVLAGCGEVSFKAISSPPPDRTALLDDAEGTIAVSQGVALAIECTSTSSGHAGPCDGMTQRVDDPGVARVLPVDLDELRQRIVDGTVDNQKPAVFVLAGVKPGTTTVRVTTEHGGATLEVTVAPVPAAR